MDTQNMFLTNKVIKRRQLKRTERGQSFELEHRFKFTAKICI